jgi:hypothetical protein
MNGVSGSPMTARRVSRSRRGFFPPWEKTALSQSLKMAVEWAGRDRISHRPHEGSPVLEPNQSGHFSTRFLDFATGPIRHGSDEGRWFWSMTVSRPGPSFNARSGTEARRGDAGQRVIEAYEAMLARTRGWKPAPEDDDEA